MCNLPGSYANNIYSTGSGELTEVQLFMSTSCQTGSRVNIFLLTRDTAVVKIATSIFLPGDVPSADCFQP